MTSCLCTKRWSWTSCKTSPKGTVAAVVSEERHFDATRPQLLSVLLSGLNSETEVDRRCDFFFFFGSTRSLLSLSTAANLTTAGTGTDSTQKGKNAFVRLVFFICPHHGGTDLR